MKVNPLNNQLRNNTNFKASVKFSPNFNQYYTTEKLDEVTKAIHKLGSITDSINLTLNKLEPGWSIKSLGLINNKEVTTYHYDNSRYAALRNTLDSLRKHFDPTYEQTALRNTLNSLRKNFVPAYGQNCKNIDGQSDAITETGSIKQETKPILHQKSTEKPAETSMEKVIEKGVSKDFEELINKKVEEKIKNLVDTKLETIVEQVLLKQIKSDTKMQRNIQEIIKESTNEVGEALVKLSREYTNSVNDPNHPQRGLLGALHNELSKLLELANSNYEGGIS